MRRRGWKAFPPWLPLGVVLAACSLSVPLNFAESFSPAAAQNYSLTPAQIRFSMIMRSRAPKSVYYTYCIMKALLKSRPNCRYRGRACFFVLCARPMTMRGVPGVFFNGLIVTLTKIASGRVLVSIFGFSRCHFYAFKDMIYFIIC